MSESEPTGDLERLISRYLDGESPPRERRELNDRLRRDPRAAALFEEHSALDREVKSALRYALDRPPVAGRVLPRWERLARVVALAAAACLAAMFWLTPNRSAPGSHDRAAAQAASWFAPPPTFGDTLIAQPERFNRPQIRVDRPNTNWILVPSDKPGEFLVIEVERVLTRTIPVQHDF
jgi:hypothetical protein